MTPSSSSLPLGAFLPLTPSALLSQKLYRVTPLLRSIPLTWRLEQQQRQSGSSSNHSAELPTFEETTTTTSSSGTSTRPKEPAAENYASPQSRPTTTSLQVYLKLDCLQDSGSFKDRGMAHFFTQTLLAQYHHHQQHQQQQDSASDSVELSSSSRLSFWCSSGGNAGLAAVTVGTALGVPVHVVVPTTTKPHVCERLKQLGAASVTITGQHWNEADAYTRAQVAKSTSASAAEASSSSSSSRAYYVSPYDHPLLWTGHATVVDEIFQQLPDDGPDPWPQHLTIIVSVGGGGLLCGILEGLARQGPDCVRRTTVICAETQGAASFAASWQAQRIVSLPAITSVATSLGALTVTAAALERAQQHVAAGGQVRSMVVTDAEAVQACLQLADDHRWLVEPACGAALAVLYSDRCLPELLSQQEMRLWGPVVVQVCGGSGVNLELLAQWKQDFHL